MVKLDFKYLYNKISKSFKNNIWLKKQNINKEYISLHMDSLEFNKKLSKMILNKDFSAKSTLQLCTGLLKNIYPIKSEKECLNKIYNYCLNKIFPNIDKIQSDSNLDICAEVFLKIFCIINDFEKNYNSYIFKGKYPLNFLKEEEIQSLERPQEYKKFLSNFKKDYIYEMMKLSEEIMGFNTLDHVCGVHYLCLHIGRQLKTLGIPIDLGRVSGAGAGHDIGKYGCTGEDLKRVPHLHYYYTDQWFKKYDIPYIGNIAMNHSTWDLEVENLSLESLILIYSDFRVKNMETESGYKMHIYSLKDSFYVILNKLESLDEKKEKRYKAVYEKLKDFEDYLISLNINVGPNKNISNHHFPLKNIEYSLMQGEEIINNLKNISIYHSIYLMHQLRDEISLETILDSARSEKDWKNLREYIRVLQEYSTYLTQKQKKQTLKFLFENLTHPEDDIRKHCAELIGKLIAIFDESYMKEIPSNVELPKAEITSVDVLSEYLKAMLSPPSNMIYINKFNLGYNISTMVESLFKYCKETSLDDYRKVLLNSFDYKKYKNVDIQLFLLDTAKYIPIDFSSKYTKNLWDFIFNILKKRNQSLRLGALKTLNLLIKENVPQDIKNKIEDYLNSSTINKKYISENLLKLNLAKSLNMKNLYSSLEKHIDINKKLVTEIFLSNLKSNTSWIKKHVQIDLLLKYVKENPSSFAMNTVIHFSNLLKVSDIESVRSKAGNAILDIMPYLSLAERNEIAIELLRGLEIEGNRFTEYIPTYAGQVILWLQPIELDEIIKDLTIKFKKSNTNLKCLLLKTIGITISNYPIYKIRFKENIKFFNDRLINMIGILLNGLGDYNIQVKQSAFISLGKHLFSEENSFEEKSELFKLTAKKILTLIAEDRNKNLMMLTNSVGMHYIYRFISDYNFYVGDLNIPSAEKVAFFPGTFDPFSASHKEIAKALRNMGFEVFLSVDEFSWSKRTLPSLLRRDILNLSIADQLNIYIYPASIPINIANNENLKKLKNLFPKSELYIAVGSDVVLNASSYKKENINIPNSIFNFSHIIFQRGKNNERLDEIISYIKRDVLIFSLSSKYSEISSTQIRNYIDENKNISSLVDPIAEKYIYEKGFYQRESQDKSIIKPISLRLIILNSIDDFIMNEISSLLKDKIKNMKEILDNIRKKPSSRIILIRDKKNELIGFSLFHWIRSTVLYEEMKDNYITEYIRNNSTGRMLSLDGFYIKNIEKSKYIEQVLVTETLAFCASRDYEYAIFHPKCPEFQNPSIIDILKLQGFIKVSDTNNSLSIYTADMSNPCILNLDIENFIKEPYRNNQKIKNAILESRKKLQKSLTNLYKGELVLSFDSNFLHQAMIDKICSENDVPSYVEKPRNLGNAMCVPYGDILDRYIVPNTVTKALHTEKIFYSNMKNFKIGEFPHYLDLNTQVRMLKSFNRSVILVDNLLHKGYRIKALDPIFKEENLGIKNIVVGIMSGRGKDLMDKQNRSVDSVYFIPRLKLWFDEVSMYPFMGGDLLWRGKYPKRNLLPSINLILPYTYPKFIVNSNKEAIFNLSKTCIENSINILKVIEEEYRSITDRNLSLYLLGHVFNIPRCPDQGKNMYYDLNLSPSHYLKNDLEKLLRLENVMKD
ncbi:cytidyltransferase [Clostridium sporogenes]|uniref:nicotinate-nucleotide adenylyltransferase n=1 Tax=Clostridium sporogenes TaxID=1509 RepID=A0AAE4FMA5_CLOSG|nr:cytidyltransferase [Clostridium sporogenes]MDS1004383.1 cytidyltransferase [Clostridium sporogenes]